MYTYTLYIFTVDITHNQPIAKSYSLDTKKKYIFKNSGFEFWTHYLQGQ